MLFCLDELPVTDQDYIRLQFLGARNAWLGCPNRICDLRRCSSQNDSYFYMSRRCLEEKFQIIGEGGSYASIISGQRIRLRYPHEPNTWMSCASTTYCNKSTCPGTTSEGGIFGNIRCYGEIFIIHSRGKTFGQTINNGDLVMLNYPYNGTYISIQRKTTGTDTSLDFCPGMAPPAYLSYAMCSKNVFRIYKQP